MRPTPATMTDRHLYRVQHADCTEYRFITAAEAARIPGAVLDDPENQQYTPLDQSWTPQTK